MAGSSRDEGPAPGAPGPVGSVRSGGVGRGVGRDWYRPMRGRDVEEEGRTATPLELLYDLCFVVAVAQLGTQLEHSLGEAHYGHGVLGFVFTFFAIWWAWMNFTWFSSAYDTDDVAYRVATLVQITGVLILAAGVPRAFDAFDFTVPIVGYAVMRTALIAQWLRAAGETADADRRGTALRYARGIAVAEVGWIVWLFVPDEWRVGLFVLLAVVELAVPAYAERRAVTPWHPHHISERYGLFTIIVLGESITAATVGIQQAVDGEAEAGLYDLATVVVGGLLIMFAMWWQYFSVPAHELVRARGRHLRGALTWGYGHVWVFAGAAAVGPGLVVAAHHAIGESHLSARAATAAVAVPAALYLLAVEFVQLRPYQRSPLVRWAFPGCAVLVLAAVFVPQGVLVIGLLMTASVVVAVTVTGRIEEEENGAGADVADGAAGRVDGDG